MRQAALELFRERGYDATTAAEIAARAGVTERTFFRHFPDKREALFDGEDAFRAALSDGVLAAPAHATPMEALFHAFRSVEPMISANRAFAEPREAVIAQTPALQERVLTKTAGLIATLSAALRRRGVDEAVAGLAAQVGMAALSYAARTWAQDPAAGMDAHLRRAFDALQRLSAPGAPTVTQPR
ncbi:MAG TPA: helix-turn-helix domain-containing protein [Caulobacteraceae bacterium]|nr:helix-turn-helix domain-containing protein [Caulobacteraceae bacterium]